MTVITIHMCKNDGLEKKKKKKIFFLYFYIREVLSYSRECGSRAAFPGGSRMIRWVHMYVIHGQFWLIFFFFNFVGTIFISTSVNFLNIQTPKIVVVITLKLCGSTIRVMSPNDADRVANSVDPDQSNLSENLGSLR